MNISIRRLKPDAEMPVFKTQGSAAADLAACVDEPVTLRPGERALIPTGLAMAVPEGYEAQIRSRSGLSLNHGITLMNGIGTIDSDYRGEIGVILVNLGQADFVVEQGMRIAQLALSRYENVEFEVVDALNETIRGKGGYGSTGH